MIILIFLLKSVALDVTLLFKPTLPTPQDEYSICEYLYPEEELVGDNEVKNQVNTDIRPPQNIDFSSSLSNSSTYECIDQNHIMTLQDNTYYHFKLDDEDTSESEGISTSTKKFRSFLEEIEGVQTSTTESHQPSRYRPGWKVATESHMFPYQEVATELVSS